MKFVHVVRYSSTSPRLVFVHEGGERRCHRDVTDESMERLSRAVGDRAVPVRAPAFEENYVILLGES